MTKKQTIEAWWIAGPEDRLGYGDNRIAKKGVTHKVPKNTTIRHGEVGLHANSSLYGALSYAPPWNVSSKLWRVELSGFPCNEAPLYTGSFAARTRKYLFSVENYATVIRDSLFTQAVELNKKANLGFPEFIIDYLKEPLNQKHRAFHKELKEIKQEPNFRFNNSGYSIYPYGEDNPGLAYNINSLIGYISLLVPKANNCSSFDVNELSSLHDALAIKHSQLSDKKHRRPRQEDVKKELQKLLKVPRNDIQKGLIEVLNAWDGQGVIHRYIRNEMNSKREAADKIVMDRVFKDLKEASK